MSSGIESASTDTHVDAAAFDLAPVSTHTLGATRGHSAAALCLHGLTGTPYEVRPLAEALAARGIRALGPVLPGHGSTPEDLSRTHHREWLDFVRAEFRALRAEYEQLFVVGVSMGGLLSLALAAENDCEGVGVVGSPVEFSWPIRTFIPILKHLKPMLPKQNGPDIADPEARRRHPGYDVMPLAAVQQLIRLQSVVRGGLSRVRAPTFVAHGDLDNTAHPRDADFIYSGVAASRKQLLRLERSAHVVPVDYEGAELAQALAGFMAAELSAAEKV